MSNIPKGFKQTEVGVIPEDWVVKKLGDGINLLSGHHVLAQYCNTEGIGFPYITGPADFQSGTIKHSKFTVKPTTICRTNDILVTVKGSGAGTMVLADAEYSISRQLMAVRVTDWDTSYIYYSLMRYESIFGAVATGLIPGLSRGDILNKVVPLPPTKAEQTAIAAVLSDTDALISSLEKLIAKKRNIKQGAMQELLTGRKRLPGVSGEWEVKRLGEIAPLQRGFDLPTIQLQAGKYPVVYSNGIENFHSEYRAKAPGVVTGRSGTIGKVTYVEEHYWPHNTSLWVTDFKQNLPLFIYYLYLHLKLERFGTGSGVPTLNRNDVHDFKAAIPNFAEQTAIAQILSDMDAEIEKLEQKLGKYRQIKQGMMQELLTGKIRIV